MEDLHTSDEACGASVGVQLPLLVDLQLQGNGLAGCWLISCTRGKEEKLGKGKL